MDDGLTQGLGPLGEPRVFPPKRSNGCSGLHLIKVSRPEQQEGKHPAHGYRGGRTPKGYGCEYWTGARLRHRSDSNP